MEKKGESLKADRSYAVKTKMISRQPLSSLVILKLLGIHS